MLRRDAPALVGRVGGGICFSVSRGAGSGLSPGPLSLYPCRTMTITDVSHLLGLLPDVESRAGAGSPADAVDGRDASAIATPCTLAAVAAIMRQAAAHGLRVVPRGGGSALGLGNTPTSVDIVLDLSRLDRVVEYRPRDLMITVEAGVTMAGLRRTLEAHGQMVTLDPPLLGRATAGGTLAANVTGPHRFRYGTGRDVVIGTTAVLADGTEVKSGGRVVKNVAGYDMNKLFIGSVGTLAVITSATFKLRPAPAHRTMLAAGFDTVDQAHLTAMRIAGSTLAPLSLELVNAESARGLGLNLPPVAIGADDLPDGGPWWLFSELGGSMAAIERTRGEWLALARDAGCLTASELDPAVHEQTAARLRDSGHLLHDGSATVLRVAVLSSRTAAAISLITAEPGAGERPAIIAHAGNGIVRACWGPGVGEGLAPVTERLRAALRPLGGIVTVERCTPGDKVGLDVWGIDGPDLALMRKVKKAFDPVGILSPGRGPAG